MVCRLLLWAACVGTAFAAEAPNLEMEGPEVAAISDTESFNFNASGGETDPPDSLGDGPWVRTGRRQYIWRVEVTEPVPGETENPHPLDGTVTTSGAFSIPRDKPGSFSVTVSLQEEWQDISNPQFVIFWPMAKGQLPPSAAISDEGSTSPQPTPAPLMPAFPIVPPFATSTDRK